MFSLAARVSALLLLFSVLIPGARASASGGAPLSAADRAVADGVANVARHSLSRAASFAGHQTRIARVEKDSSGIQLTFHDGARVLILPPLHLAHAALVPLARTYRPMADSSPSPALRHAAVLLPFQNELGEGADAAQAEINALKSAGFSVDVFRNTDVTVALMQKLTAYSVVYMETHSYVSEDGSVAVLVTGETDTGPAAPYLRDGTVQQALVAGDPSRTLYLGVNQDFITKHMGSFPDSSLLDLNGCDVLRATDFWNALHDHNVATLISWDHEVYNTINEFSADYMFPRLAANESVKQVIQETAAVGLGSSVVGTTVAHLGYLGDGDNTLSRALSGATPTPTDTPTATPTDTPTSTPTDTPTAAAVAVHRVKCKKGYKRVKKHGKYRCIKRKKHSAA